MKLLLDTHLLIWVAEDHPRLSQKARDLIGNPGAKIYFSASSIWEIAIKSGLGRADFQVDIEALRCGLLKNDYIELPVTSDHAVAVTGLPAIHRDPFDRILVAQSVIERLTLLTTDSKLAQYGGHIQLV